MKFIMKLNNIWHNKPIKIGACYILFIFAAIALCFYVAGVREIVSYASKSKPYATIFSQGAFGWDAVQFETNETKRDPVHDKQKPATILLLGDSSMFWPG